MLAVGELKRRRQGRPIQKEPSNLLRAVGRFHREPMTDVHRWDFAVR